MSATPEPAVNHPSDVGQDHVRMEACDLCGSTQSIEVATEASTRCRTVLCADCGLLYAAPRLPDDDLLRHYDDEFTGDAGSAVKAAGAGVARRKVSEEERLATGWALPLMRRYTELEGKTVLNLRCRTGALSACLRDEGASVVSVDPFDANVDAARRERGLPELFCIPLTRFEDMTLPDVGEFDAVLSLNVHLLAHLSSPRRFLERMFEIMKPGGYLMLDEKDVLRPRKHVGDSVFDSGKAHNYHFTLSTFAYYARSAGFEVIECRINPHRWKAFQHMIMVARKPEAPKPEEIGPTTSDGKSNADDILSSLRRIERLWPLRRIKRSVRSVSRRIRGVRSASGTP